jgi:hypothetical protein
LEEAGGRAFGERLPVGLHVVRLHLVRFQSNKVRILYLKVAAEAPL